MGKANKRVETNLNVIAMKILVIHPYLSDIGGAEEVLINILEALMKRKHDVFVLGKFPKKSEFEKIASANITQIPYDSSGFEIKRFQAYQKLLFKHDFLRNKLSKKIGHVDLEISTQDPMFFLGVGKKQIAYVHFPENLTRLMEGGNRRSKFFWKLFYLPISLRLRQRVSKANLLLCNSEYTKDAIMRYWGITALVVYPPVDVNDFHPAPKEDFVVSVGRFVPIKNYELIVEVAKLMPSLKFIIIGRRRVSDDYYEKIKRLKPANVELIGDATRSEIVSKLSRAKIYLHAMVGEHFGISVVEAMAAGCIPIVHDSGGPKEVIGPFGYVYKSTAECVECVNKALESKIEPQKIAERTKHFSSENFKKNFARALEACGFL